MLATFWMLASLRNAVSNWFCLGLVSRPNKFGIRSYITTAGGSWPRKNGAAIGSSPVHCLTFPESLDVQAANEATINVATNPATRMSRSPLPAIVREYTGNSRVTGGFLRARFSSPVGARDVDEARAVTSDDSAWPQWTERAA